MQRARARLCPRTTAVTGVLSNDPLMKLRVGGDGVRVRVCARVACGAFISSALTALAGSPYPSERARRCTPDPYSNPSIVEKHAPTLLERFKAISLQLRCPDRSTTPAQLPAHCAFIVLHLFSFPLFLTCSFVSNIHARGPLLDSRGPGWGCLSWSRSIILPHDVCLNRVLKMFIESAVK